jgi:thiamine-phosphate pyrophosphorylase
LQALARRVAASVTIRRVGAGGDAHDGPSAPAPGAALRARLADARLYLIVEVEPHGRPAAELVGPALDGGVDVVQLRDKEADDGRIVEAARSLRTLCAERAVLLIMNDRPELAIDAGCDGVHLGQADAPVDEARALLGADGLIGVSTHSPEQITAARESLADYIAVGPVHATPTKPDAQPVGTALVSQAAREAGKPFFAIGGIDAANVGAVVAAGAERIAVVRAIRDAADPRAAAEALYAAVAGGARAGAAS